MKIIRRKLESWTEEDSCGFCGCPCDYPGTYYEIEDGYQLFCSKGCAADYAHNADYEPAN